MKRLWLIGDIHFGNKSNSFEWLGYQRQLFRDLYIPHFEKHVKEGDCLLFMGDMFDNKTLLNVTILNEVVELLADVGEFFESVFSLVGNHDVPRKDASINSYTPLRLPSNFHIVDKPTIIESVFGQKIAMVPWNKSYDDELKILEELPDDVFDLFMHTFIIGFTFNGIFKPENTEQKKYGNEISDFSKFTRVWSGHVHTPQKKANIIFTGAALHLNRNDVNQNRYFYVLDYENGGSYTEFVNELSPKFRRMTFEEFVELDESEVENMSGDFMELYVDETMMEEWINEFRDCVLEDFKLGNLTYLPVSRYGTEDDGQKVVVPERLDIYEELEKMVNEDLSYQEYDSDHVVSLVLEAKDNLT